MLYPGRCIHLKSVNSTKTFQQDIFLFLNSCRANGMKINVTKTLHFGSKNPHHSYLIDNAQIEEVVAFRDLVVIVDNRLCFSHHISYLLPKLYSLLHRFFCTLSSLSKLHLYLQLFNSCPILSYASHFVFRDLKKIS